MKIDSPTQVRSRGFTLIELLVVISIIAILAGLAVPVFSKAQKRARLSESLSNAKQVGLALKMYASDNGGAYPVKDTAGTADAADANKALENLLPKYSNNKVIFINKASKWCTGATVDTTGDEKLLKAGQNDWMYFRGLSETADSRWPLFATATSDATAGQYVTGTTKKGGVWDGSDCIAGFPDGSARQISGNDMTSSTPNTSPFFPKRPDDATKSLLAVATPWLDGVTPLSPTSPP